MSLILEIEKAKEALIGAVNDAVKRGVPHYFLEPFLHDLANKSSEMARQEVASLKKEEGDKK